MANNKYNRYTSNSKQYFTSASSNAAIKADSNGIQKLHTDVSALIGDCRELYSRVINVASNLDGEVLSRYSISSLLSALQNSISKSIEALESNNNGLNTYNNEINNADKLLANSMRGVQSLANMIVTPAELLAPFSIGGQILMSNIALLNGLFGLNTTTSTQGTNLGFFDSIKQFGIDAFNKAKDTVTKVLDNKWVKVGLSVASIVGTVGAIVGSGVLTVFSGGAATPGAVAVTVFGVNNIISQASNIVSAITENEDLAINPLKDISKTVCRETAGLAATGLNKVGIVSDEYIDIAKEYAENVGAIGFDIADVAVGNIKPVDNISNVTTISSNIIKNADKTNLVAQRIDKITSCVEKIDNIVKPLNNVNDVLDWQERVGDAYQYTVSKQKFTTANINAVTSAVKDFIQ